MKELPNIQVNWCDFIGRRIFFEPSKSGILRYYGKIECFQGFWLGIELDDATGKNDGSINGKKYFSCEDQHGIFIPESSTADITLTKACSEEYAPSNNFELGMNDVFIDEKAFNSLESANTSAISTEKENLSLVTFPYSSDNLMVPKILPCKLSIVKEENEHCIDVSHSTSVLCSYGVNQASLMKTYNLDSTFDIRNNTEDVPINLVDNNKEDGNSTGTDESLGILPALLNDSPTWDHLSSDNEVRDFTHFLNLKNTCNKTKKSNLSCTTSSIVAFHTSKWKEDSLFHDADSPIFDTENIPVCVSTPKHEIFFTNFIKKHTGLHVPKQCSSLAVSGDSTLGLNMMQEQIFNFPVTSTVENFGITFMESQSETPCIDVIHSVSKTASETKLFESEISAINPDTVKASVPAENIIKSTLEPSINVLNSTFNHNSTESNFHFTGENYKQTDVVHNDIIITNDLNKTFRLNEERKTMQKKESVSSKSNFINSSELPKPKLYLNSCIGKHFDCIKESLTNDYQKKKNAKLQSELPSPENLSKTIRKTTNLPILSKNRFGVKSGQTRRASSSEPCRKNKFIKARQSLSGISDLKKSVGPSFGDKNKSKHRSSLSSVENKSYALLNSTVTITESTAKNLLSQELSENYSNIPDSVEMLNSVNSEKNIVSSSSTNTSCKSRVLENTLLLSKEPIFMNPNYESTINVGSITSTKPFCIDNDAVFSLSENENTNCVFNSETFLEIAGHSDNLTTINVSEPLVTIVVTDNKESNSELNAPSLTGGDDEKHIKNELDESIVICDNTVALANQFQESLNKLNSLTVTKKGSYKKFANTLNAQNSKTALSTSLCSTSRNENLSKSIVKKSKAGTFGFVETTDKANTMNNKMPNLSRLASQSESCKKGSVSVRQSTGSVFNSTSSSIGSSLRITNSKTSSNLRKHSFNQKDLPCFGNKSVGNSNVITNSAQIKKASTLPSKKVLESGTSICAAVTKAIKHSQQQNENKILKKTSVVEKMTSIKCPSVKLKMVKETVSKSKPDTINKANLGKNINSKLPSSKINSLIKPTGYTLKPNTQPLSGSRRFSLSRKEDKNVPVPTKGNVQRKSENSGLTTSNIPKQRIEIPKLTEGILTDKNAPVPTKGNVQRKSAENSGLTRANIPKQRTEIPKLTNGILTGSGKNPGIAVRKIKSPCQRTKKL